MTQLAVLFMLLVCNCACCGATRKREKNGGRPQALSDVAYETIEKILRHEPLTRVENRSKEEENARVRLWRNKGRYSICPDTDRLLFDKKVVLKTSDLKNTVLQSFNTAKGSGPRLIHKRMEHAFIGASRRRVKHILDKSKQYQRSKARFNNKAKITPIKAKQPNERHQIDLVDMRRWKIRHDGETYRYVLSVLDVFSRYVWLVPLPTKASFRVAAELQRIYLEHGPPRIIQHDRGPEFQKHVQNMANRLKVRIIQSSAYHPQSQGKCERSHRTFRNKLWYDLTKMSRSGVDWVDQLGQYSAVLNGDSKQCLGWRYPFYVYFGRHSNRIVHPLHSSLLDVSEVEKYISITDPDENDYAKFAEKRRRIRMAARKASAKYDEKTILREMKNNPPSVYKDGELVLVRIKDKTHRLNYRYRVCEGVILRKSKRFDKYLVLLEDEDERRWFSVADITSTNRALEREKRMKAQRRQLILKYKIPKNPMDKKRLYKNIFRSSDFKILMDPAGDGDCQFAALSHQLANFGIHRSAETLRADIVRDLRRDPFVHDGGFIGDHVEVGSITLDRYLSSMSSSGTYGDEITLQRTADMYRFNILVLSSLCENATRLIEPREEAFGTLTLAHLAEDQGEHYMSIELEDLDRYLNLFRRPSAHSVPEAEVGFGLSETEEDQGLHVTEGDQSLPEAGVGQGLPKARVGQCLPEAEVSQGPHEVDGGQCRPKAGVGQGLPEAEVCQDLPEAGVGQVLPEAEVGQGLPEAQESQGPHEADVGKCLPVVQVGQDLPEAGVGQVLPEAEVGQGLPEAQESQGPHEADVGKCLPVVQVGQGLPDAGVSQGHPEAKMGQGLPEAGLSQGHPEAKMGQGLPRSEGGQGLSGDEVGPGLLETEEGQGPLVEDIWHIILPIAFHSYARNLLIIPKVCQMFADITNFHLGICGKCKNLSKCFDKLLPIHIYPGLLQELGIGCVAETSTLSVQRLIRTAGKGSGLALALKDMLVELPRWWFAWLVLRRIVMRPGTYFIEHIFWK